jgi:hypothetical protein
MSYKFKIKKIHHNASITALTVNSIADKLNAYILIEALPSEYFRPPIRVPQHYIDAIAEDFSNKLIIDHELKTVELILLTKNQD